MVAATFCLTIAAMIPIPLLVVYSLQRSIELPLFYDLLLGPLWPLMGLPGLGTTLVVLITLYDVWNHERGNRYWLVLVVFALQLFAVVPYWIVELRCIFRRLPSE